MAKDKKKATRPIHRATVTGTSWVSRDMVRVSLISADLRGIDLPFTNRYVKLLFPNSAHKRSFTLRHHDAATGEIDIDFAIHGGTSKAASWARHTQPGDEISFYGPRGTWRPPEDVAHIVFAADESAAPAVLSGVEELPESISADVHLEVADDQAHIDLPTVCDRENIAVHWVHRDGAHPGIKLLASLRDNGVPATSSSWFIHSVAEMIPEMRRFLFVENAIAAKDVSLSGYWRMGKK